MAQLSFSQYLAELTPSTARILCSFLQVWFFFFSVCSGVIKFLLYPQRQVRTEVSTKKTCRFRFSAFTQENTHTHLQSSTAADICPWGFPPSCSFTATHTHNLPLSLPVCLSLHLSLFAWSSFLSSGISLCLPEIFSWPQSTASCGGLLLQTSVRGTTCDRQRGKLRLRKIKIESFKKLL